ncbi:MAG: hypothetical protein AABW47_02460 [Nanoarchaeota archaeon]
MLSYNKRYNNRGQSQTVFWFFATFTIVAILTIFILLSISMSAVKNIKSLLSPSFNLKSGFEGESQVLLKKTIIAYELNNANKEQIELVLKQK